MPDRSEPKPSPRDDGSRPHRPAKTLNPDEMVGKGGGVWRPPDDRQDTGRKPSPSHPRSERDTPPTAPRPDDGDQRELYHARHGVADDERATDEPGPPPSKTLSAEDLTDTEYRPWTHRRDEDEPSPHRKRLHIPNRPHGRYREDRVLDPKSRIRADGTYADAPTSPPDEEQDHEEIHHDPVDSVPPEDVDDYSGDESDDESVDESGEPLSPPEAATAPALPSLAWITLLIVAGARLLLYLVVNALDSYGIFRDEYYYLACADRLAWGYVDQPPFSILMLWLQTGILGDSLFAIRLVPALLGAGTVFGVGMLTREFGGGRFAQLTAALLAFFAPVYLSFAGVASMNIWDLAFWLAVLILVARWMNGAPDWFWPIIGAVLGLGLLNKISVLYLGVGLLAGLLVSHRRRVFLTPWPWVAAFLAFLILLPHLLWQTAHDWPTLEFIHNARTYKNAEMTPLSWIGAVLLQQNPMLVPLLVLGGIGLALAGGVRRHLWALVLSVTVLLVLLITGGAKPYYAATAFLPLWAAAGIPLERWFAVRKRWVLGLVPGWIVVFGVALVPFSIPVLPPATFVAYQSTLGLEPPREERGPQGALPQFFADRFGWRTLADEVALIYHGLTPRDQSRTVIFGQNYGQAGALEYYREEFNLPPIFSAHNSYWLWGTGGHPADIVIVIGDNRARLLELFDSVERMGTKKCQWCMPYEDNLPIWLCRGAEYPWEVIWPEIKTFI